jgi:uncharacterized protein (TIGR02246 family)
MRLVPCLLLSLVCAAGFARGAGDGKKEEIVAAGEKWAKALASRNVDAILACYDPKAVLWPTLSAKRHDTPEAIRGYFTRLTAKKGLKVTFGEAAHLIRFYGKGEVAINSGDYVFSYEDGGKTVSLPARFSFVYRKTPGGWKIIDHHSSAMPAEAK